MPFILQQPQRIDHAPYVFTEGLFSAEDCKKIINLSEEIEKAPALVGDKSTTDEKKRISDLYWVNWCQELDQVFKTIGDNVIAANNKWWGFHLSGLHEAMQLTHYKGTKKKQGHYDWHEDWAEGPGFSHRKLSGVILLSDEFTGGEFEFLHLGVPKEIKVGTMILFPSFRTHRVRPVTKGNRWSLVFWVNGPPFC